VSQTPGGYYQQSQGEAPWDNDPPTSFPQAAQPGAQPFGYGPPKGPPPRRPRRKRPRKRNVILLGFAALLVIGVIASAVSNNKSTKTKVTAAASTAANASAGTKKSASPSRRASTKAKAMAAKATSCDDRSPASGDIYVRTVTPGSPAQTEELGGEWRWDHATDKCLTSVQLTVATAPRSPGHCTQVGYVSDNPGYSLNHAVAPRLTDVVAQKGPACRAAAGARVATPSTAPSAPATTAPPPATTAPAPATSAPAAPATPAGCYPTSDEGTCYEPGEYCRDDDHGMSGVAGDGESIVCEDNDGWRWEPE
jgi:hypothetical protein